MSARFGEWYKEATENCAERELYATSLIARMDWLVDPKSENNSRYDLTTELNKNHSSAWYDVATEICNKRKETVIRALLEDNIEIENVLIKGGITMNLQEVNALDKYLTTPPETFYEEKIDETADYDKDSMGETIAQEDGVFEIVYTVTTVMSNRCLKIKTEKAIVTQQDIVDFILEIGEEKITSIKFVGLGEKYLEE